MPPEQAVERAQWLREPRWPPICLIHGSNMSITRQSYQPSPRPPAVPPCPGRCLCPCLCLCLCLFICLYVFSFLCLCLCPSPVGQMILNVAEFLRTLPLICPVLFREIPGNLYSIARAHSLARQCIRGMSSVVHILSQMTARNSHGKTYEVHRLCARWVGRVQWSR